VECQVSKYQQLISNQERCGLTVFISEIKNGRRANRRTIRPDDFRSDRYDEAILANVDRGHHYASLVDFSLVLRKGEELTVVYGSTDAKAFHEICVALKMLTKWNHIAEL